MDSVISSHEGPILASETPPESTAYYQRWLKLPAGVMYKYEGGEWVPAGGGIDLAHDGDKMEITKLTIVDGMITELEYGS